MHDCILATKCSFFLFVCFAVVCINNNLVYKFLLTYILIHEYVPLGQWFTFAVMLAHIGECV